MAHAHEAFLVSNSSDFQCFKEKSLVKQHNLEEEMVFSMYGVYYRESRFVTEMFANSMFLLCLTTS